MYIFSPPGCWKQARRAICSAVVSYLFNFLTIRLCQTNISKSTGPIFAEVSWLVELWLLMISLKLVFQSRKDIAMATKFCWFYPHNWFDGRRRLVAQPGVTLGFAVRRVPKRRHRNSVNSHWIFKKKFRCQIIQQFCSKVFIKDPTARLICSYTTLWNINVRKWASRKLM